MRQVTHALLTRPPLSHFTPLPERIEVKRFARLACVRHAASVHPEPGSNSRYKFFPVQESLLAFLFPLYRSCHSLRSGGCSANLPSSGKLAVPKNSLSEIFKDCCCLLFSCQGSFLVLCRSCSERQLIYVTTTVSLCQELF